MRVWPTSGPRRRRTTKGFWRRRCPGWVSLRFVCGDATTGTQGFGCLRQADSLAIIAFRGTQPEEATDLATDLQAITVPWPESGGRVHRGFAKSMRSVLPDVHRWLESEGSARANLLICGHSLGAALATLTASVFTKSSLVTLGSPRVGDEAFASTFRDTDITRAVDCCDIVTQLPPETPWYTHVGTKMYVNRNGAVAVGPSTLDVLEDQARARSEYILDTLGRQVQSLCVIWRTMRPSTTSERFLTAAARITKGRDATRVGMQHSEPQKYAAFNATCRPRVAIGRDLSHRGAAIDLGSRRFGWWHFNARWQI